MVAAFVTKINRGGGRVDGRSLGSVLFRSGTETYDG